MKVPLDACVPRPLSKYLTDHTIHTAQEMGWGQLKNGALLRKAEAEIQRAQRKRGQFLRMATSIDAHCLAPVKGRAARG